VLNRESIKNALSIYRGKRKEKILASTIPEAWNKIISEPDQLLIELIIEVVEKLCGYKPESEMISDFLKKNVDKLMVLPDFEIEKPPTKSPGGKIIHKPVGIPPDNRISQDELIPYIIALLYNFGGSAEKSKIDDEIYKIFKHQFSDPWYHELVSHGVERWKHNIAWAKERAIQHHKLIKPASESGRGIWELTEKGKEYYQKIREKINI
ncbi:MAG TPA: winged helix-turn-helix domain-containing protein, partial [Candidatus Marinimicrobia bacterium]|nr:winged helix-turn-helix domain-containing protein [Candidatus Neomarinimicrobiota bacterium]